MVGRLPTREMGSIFGFYRWSNGITRSQKVQERESLLGDAPQASAGLDDGQRC